MPRGLDKSRGGSGVDERLLKRIRREMWHSMGREGGQLSVDRTQLKRRYLGYGYQGDDERKARQLSTYVDRTVMETVEWALPGLMRVFSGDEIIRFEPRTPEQEQAAGDATMYVNQVVFGRAIFSLVHDVLKDGLYQRVGWCLAHCPKREEQRVREYTGLSQEEAAALLQDPSIDLDTEGAVRVQQYDTPFGPLFDLVVHQAVEVREVKVEPVPSEQVIISDDAQDVEHARFCAVWQLKTASDLRKEGYDEATIDDLPPYNSADTMPESAVGRRINSADTETYEGEGSAREYKVYEGWLDFDADGDGIAEKVKVTFCGEYEACRILKWEEWPLYRAPLFAACSVPMPHQAVGLCLADLVSDIQDLRTEVTRQYLDNLALANQGEIVVNEGTTGDVEYDSLLARGVGAVHRIRGDATITPLPVATSSREALDGLDMSSGMIERRTGISPRTQSLQADTLQNTATGASIMEEAINQRLELIARCYAEQFFKPLGKYILHLVHRYQDKAIQLRLKGRFMAFDPRKWDPDMDIAVAVGLGTGDRSKLIAAYRQIVDYQTAFLTQLGPNSPVRLSNIVYTLHKMCEAAGLESPERFFGTEEDAQRAEQAMMQEGDSGPSPEEQKLLLDKQKADAKIALDQQKAQTEAQRKAYETQANIALKEQEVQGKLALKRQEMATEAQLDATRLAMGERGAGLTNVRGAM